MERPAGYDRCNSYTTIIIDEALRRGIHVEVLEPDLGELRLTCGDEQHVVLESLSDRCSAVAYYRCEHKWATRRVLHAAGLPIPDGRIATGDDEDREFLHRHGTVVVKPVRGEGGQGVSVGVRDDDGLHEAVEAAREHAPEVLIEAHVTGEDLRIVVIGGRVVAAAVRRPPEVTGDGTRTIRQLVDELNDDRRAATGGASAVPWDGITSRTVRAAGLDLDDPLSAGQVLQVRGTANLHTGGTMHDVTDRVAAGTLEVAVAAAAALDVPLVGVDVIVPAIETADPRIIEVNPQAGLANHEPQPVVQRYVDLLFPATAS